MGWHPIRTHPTVPTRAAPSPLQVGGTTAGEVHFAQHASVPPPLRRAPVALLAEPPSGRLRCAARRSAGLAHPSPPPSRPTVCRFEAGTPAIAEAIGLGAAVHYLSSLGMDAVAEWEEALSKQLYEGLSSVPGVRILGPPPHVPQARRGRRRRLLAGTGVAPAWAPPLQPAARPKPLCHPSVPACLPPGPRRHRLVPGGRLRRAGAGAGSECTPHRSQVRLLGSSSLHCWPAGAAGRASQRTRLMRPARLPLICCSAGYHRAKPLHTDWLRVGPTMRASCYVYTTPAEVDAFVAALRECVEQRRGKAGPGSTGAAQGSG